MSTPASPAANAARVDAWVEKILSLPRPLLLAFDVDGTLAPIVNDPHAARVPPATARALRTLATRRGMRVALVTGRDAAGLNRLIRVPKAWRAVAHGRVVLEPGAPVGRPRLAPEQRKQLDGFRRWVEDALVPAGARLERKASAIGVHVRDLATHDEVGAKYLLQRAERKARDRGLVPRRGRAVVEAELEAGNKGDALRVLHRKTRARGVFYVGDDLTDLPAIRYADAQGGIGLFVRSLERQRKPRDAGGSLRGPEEVASLIAALATRTQPAAR